MKIRAGLFLRLKLAHMGNLAHPGSQIQSHVVAQKTRLPPAPAEASLHPQEQWQDAPARDTDDERPGDAGAPPAGIGTHLGNHGGQELVWVQAGKVHGGREGAVFQRTVESRPSPMDS